MSSTVSGKSGGTSAPIRFGVFDFDFLSSELRRAGVRVTIGEQPTQVLQRLLERHGELVTREDLRAILWPDQTVIEDFDQGLNAAVKRLRDVLGDSADNPQFIETVPRRGYRFIGQVDEPEALQALPISRSSELFPRRWTRSRALWAGGCTALVILAGVFALIWIPLRWTSPSRALEPARVIPLTTLPGVESFAAFSPDGNAIAFTWNGEKGDNFDIYVKDIGSSEVRRLTRDPGEDTSPVWSPDGRQIAFIRFDGVAGRLHITSALSASEVKVSAFPDVPDRLRNTVWCRGIDWSPDGQYIAAYHVPFDSSASEQNSGIYLVPVGGGSARALTHPPTPALDNCPVFSPDGRRLAFARCASSSTGRCDLHVQELGARLDPASPAQQLTKEGVSEITGVAWTRDGRSVIFGTRVAMLQTLWRVRIDGSHRPEQINTAGFAAAVPALARTRDRLAFSRDMNNLDLYSFQPGRPSQPWLSSTSTDSGSQFSPDGARVVFVSSGPGDTAEIWTAAADGADAHQLTHGPGRWQGSPRFSPDGRQVAFDSMSSHGTWHIWTVDSDGGAPRQITDDAGDQQVPTWSHDGQWIYFSANSGHGRDIWRIPAQGGRSEQVSRGGSSWFACESADGGKLLYQPVAFRDGPVIAIPATGGPAQPVLACARTGAFLDTPQGLYYLGCGPDRDLTIDAPVHLVERPTGIDRIIGTIEDYLHFPQAGGLAVSPDGREILYTRYMNRGSDLVLIENFR